MSPDDTDTPPHGTCVALGGKGVLITGASGAGKTGLALTLIRRARAGGIEAGLVADDRVILEPDASGIIARCPAPLAGKIEVRGWGIADVSDIAVPSVRLALLVRLVAAGDALRFAQEHRETVEGHGFPCLRLPTGPTASAPAAVLAALGLPVWL
ncbi:HPr kinase/phosphorylase [Oceaniradius stylonematis]|jgi:serine kinase of HPr protein (carbohydrate metabolism regulator)|uniref:HPr kinase/phosphorylase n=1 Tax=Oceaniradius stylonematis TaxID=2184161 RepID=A0A3A8AA42_9HYPH|nr:HPr kinase/phosphatase C-terminal domain-containing protein [Oceaniradius stylonematis]MCR9090106.1 HPr kinase/phosphatase C-terminal domain-containing protein [Pseudomonadota bacterium]RKF07177.1 HPr kinase/phosphorylase [Oceaniradius stylonematis]RNC96518.1 MAG: HPr kinase/phosphorylase [Oricola sp.]